MTLRTLIRRSLRFHWRSHLGVVIGAAIGSAALIGALVVGDSVKGSLRERALARLGNISFALSSGDRFFRDALPADLQADVLDRDSRAISIVSALVLQGSVALSDASGRANQVTVIGFEPDSWDDLHSSGVATPRLQAGEALLNENLARQLGVSVGDTLLLRVPKASAFSQEAAMAPRDDATISLRLRFTGIQGEQQLGGFSLTGGQVGSRNVFVGMTTLQEALGQEGRANTLLARGNTPSEEAYRYDSHLASVLRESIKNHWKLKDCECTLTRPTPSELELRTSRIFLDAPIESAALTANTNAQPMLTYIANLIVSGTNATPYSMVTAADAPWTPSDLADDEIVLNQWLADDLQAFPGVEVTLVYYDPESGARLIEHTNTFRVHSIVPMEMPWADRTLMPDFPGIEKAETTADWDTAFPLTYKIRPKDDEYWREHRGTPKAFITLAAGKEMWANRFGEVTAIRFPVPVDETVGPADYRQALEWKILSNLDPAELGLRFEPVREQALKAAKGAQDFGGLFIGFSLFLIAAALILMALLFQFGLEQRASEVGTLLALGFTHKQVRRLLLSEGAALAFIGSVIGVAGGVFYAKAMLLGLGTVWRDAVGGATLDFFVAPVSLLIGLFASTLVALFTIWLALHKQARQPAIALLNAKIGDARWESRSHACESVNGRTIGWQRRVRALTSAATVGGGALVVALGLVGWALAAGETANAGVFFGAGALVLFGGLAIVAWRLRRLSTAHRTTRTDITATSLAFRGAVRRRSRSVATAALLACGSFLILSIGVFRLDANREATERTSGTGGFALIGESTIRIVQDLNSVSGRQFFALDNEDLKGVVFVQFRVRAGDDASCLNLNRAQKPRLLGVSPDALEGRFTFAKVAKGLKAKNGWDLLRGRAGDSAEQSGTLEASPPSDERGYNESVEINAIGDLNSILWAMGKKVGDTIDYIDDQGRPFKVRIVGAVANSILQGSLIINEEEFVKRFPNESGYQYLLMDTPPSRISDVSERLSRAMQDYGLEVMPAARRLNEFNAVQNTYLGTFQVLGGLGLLLGSAGLGIVVLRNVLERRGELAVLMAVGFPKHSVERLVLTEHAALLGIGLAVGLAAAAVAVLPTLLSPGSRLPYATLVPTLLAVLVNGLIWTWAATRAALRGNLLEVLRNE